jgi:hypothetical protein
MEPVKLPSNSSHPLPSAFLDVLPAAIIGVRARDVGPVGGEVLPPSPGAHQLRASHRLTAFLSGLRVPEVVAASAASSRNRVSTVSHEKPPI